ncbi:hypothetical protein C1S80_28795 [Mycolicibacterium aubagnense]|nr:hypothetical protein C1S80_28795 [Mycolicibacterium aubagnense]
MDHDAPPWTDSDRLLTIPEAIVALRIGRSHFFKLKREGVIGTVRLGARTLVPQREITRVINEALKPRTTPRSSAPAAPSEAAG